MLATLVEHTATVHMVRFANKSSLLASGGEDGSCHIHELRRGSGGPVGFGKEKSVENWVMK